MISISIPIHSVVDAITNSSSEIFTWACDDAVTVAVGMIEELMRALGVSGKASDYFNIEVIIDSEWVEEARERAHELMEYNDFSATTEELEEHIGSGGWEHPEMLEYDGQRPKGTRLQVSTKDGTPVNLEGAFARMFESADCQY